jgi:hypothetical protein
MPTMPRAAILSLTVGCGHQGKDVHTEVFQTPEQVAGERREKLLASHKELAISVLKFSRPDITAKPAEKGEITVSADGVTQAIDLTPLENELAQNATKERAVLRRYLEEQIKSFDERCVREMGFKKARPFIRFALANETGMEAMRKSVGGAKLHETAILPSLYRVAVVRRPGSEVALTEEVISAWHTDAAALDAAAFETLSREIHEAGDKLFETIDYSTIGRTGSLRADAAVILSPDFLPAVQKAWQTRDDLVILAPSARGVQFIEEHADRIMPIVMPSWQRLLATTPDPLFNPMLLRTKEKLTAYAPPATATAPAAASQPATKPHAYIVH